VLGNVAEGHPSIPPPDPFPEFQEETERGGPIVVCLVEVQDNILDAGAVQKIKNLPRPVLDPLVIQFSQVHGWYDDDCVVFLLDLEDYACGCKSSLESDNPHRQHLAIGLPSP